MDATPNNVTLRLISSEAAAVQADQELGQTVVHVVDTLGDALRIAPLADALRRRSAICQTLVYTGSRRDSLLADPVLATFALPKRRRVLGLRVASHAERTAQALRAFERVLAEEQPSVLVVAGDGDATLACTLTAAKLAIPVLHLEAGLRANDWSASEEVNRVLADRLSDTLLVDSAESCRNLLAEGIDSVRIHEIGNPMVDTLRRSEARARTRAAWTDVAVRERAYVLVVLEHRDNLASDERLAATAQALTAIARHAPVVFVVPHDGEPRLRRDGWRERLAHGGVTCVGPLGYLELLSLKAGAGAVVTDGGGVQDETTVLGVPCFTLGATTERLLSLTHGTNTLLGDDPAEIAMVRPGRGAAATAPIPLWDGRAAERAADVLISQYVLTGALQATG